MPITGAVIRRRVEDLGVAVAFYEALTGETANRFAFSGAQLAAVGPFLLFAAEGEVGERLGNVAATLQTDDIHAQAEALERLGAELIAPPAVTPNGHRLVARHPDGAVFEYVGP